MRTLRYYVDLRAETRPDEVYLIAPEPDLRLTYRELKQSCETVGGYLLRQGLAKGDKAALMLHNGFQTARLLLGTMYSGFVVNPINLLCHGSQLEYVLNHSDTRLVFVAENLLDKLKAALAKIPRLIEAVVVDSDAAEIFDASSLSGSPLPEVGEEDDALLMYTSGTTGVPKGVVLTHKNLVANGGFVTDVHELGAADRVFATLPLYHINGLVNTMVVPLAHGGSLVMPHRFSVSNFWEQACRYRCTWINLVPTMISYLLHGPDPVSAGARLDLSHIRFCRSASAPLPPEQHLAFEKKFGIGIIETMGLTETASPAFSNPLDPKKRKVGSIGRPAGAEAKIVDAEGCELPPNMPGEIMIRGDNVMKGYYKAPDITAKTLTPDGWLRTGDLGCVDEEGYYYVTGRLKELIIKGGENIAPREIDEALLKHPAVLEAASVGIPDPHYGQEIMACVVLKPGRQCTQEEITEFCANEIGSYKTPKIIRFVDELPKGPSGKVQRLKLLET